MHSLIEHINKLLESTGKKELAQIFRFKSFAYGDDFGPHAHKRIEINYVKKGSCTMIFGKEKEEVVFNENEMMVVFPFVEHRFKPHENGVTLMQLEFSPDVFLNIVETESNTNFPFFKALFTNHRSYVKIINHIRITRAVQRIIEELMDKKEYYSQLVVMYYAELMLLISRYMVSSFLPVEGPLAKAISLLHENFTKDLSIKDIATQCGISERYLRKLFSTQLNIAAIEYLNGLKVAKAQELLTNTDSSIKEIAFACGFNSTEYFTRTFKKHTGVSAKTYKEQLMKRTNVKN